MAYRKSVKADLNDLLRLIDHALDYQYDADFFYQQMANLIKSLNKDEIENYASWYLTEEADEKGYSKIDYDKCRDKLEEFKKHYL